MAPDAKGSAGAVQTACRNIELMLGSSGAYPKGGDGLYCIKQGSTLVMISVHPWGKRAVVRLAAQLVKGVSMEVPLALHLLETNALLRFGAFAYVPAGEVVIFAHTLLDRDLGDREEFLGTIRALRLGAAGSDHPIAPRHGGPTKEDLLEESGLPRLAGDDRPAPKDLS